MPLCNPSELPNFLPPAGILLGLDYGQKRIGVAISDPARILATPLVQLEREKWGATWATLDKIINERAVVALVIGLPLNLEGESTPMVQAARTFARNILNQRDLPVCLWDERFSTAAVTRDMIEVLDSSRAKRAEKVDAAAASYMLQGMLDYLKNLK